MMADELNLVQDTGGVIVNFILSIVRALPIVFKNYELGAGVVAEWVGDPSLASGLGYLLIVISSVLGYKLFCRLTKGGEQLLMILGILALISVIAYLFLG